MHMQQFQTVFTSHSLFFCFAAVDHTDINIMLPLLHDAYKAHKTHPRNPHKYT